MLEKLFNWLGYEKKSNLIKGYCVVDRAFSFSKYNEDDIESDSAIATEYHSAVSECIFKEADLKLGKVSAYILSARTFVELPVDKVFLSYKVAEEYAFNNKLLLKPITYTDEEYESFKMSDTEAAAVVAITKMWEEGSKKRGSKKYKKTKKAVAKVKKNL